MQKGRAVCMSEASPRVKEERMSTPAWLRVYWNERLQPALERWEQERGPETELKALFEQMLVDWPQIRQRPLSDYTVATYVTQTREWLSSLPMTKVNSMSSGDGQCQHLALIYFNFPAEHWAELTMRSQSKLEMRNRDLIPISDPQGVIARGRELLSHPDWAAIAAGIIAMVGRRVGEVLVSGEIVPKSAYSVLFTGRLKLRGKLDYSFEIPTLCEAELILAAWERLREHPELLAMHLPAQEPMKHNMDAVNGKLYPKVRQAVTHFFAGLVPCVGDEVDSETLFSHLLRSLYATLAIWRYCPERVDPDTFRATILGHHYYFKAQGQNRLNYMSGHFYHRFEIVSPGGTLDGRRGIALGEPSVCVLNAFVQGVPVNQTGTGKKKVEKVKPKQKKRNSPSGYTLLKPRNESGRRFDRIAQVHDLAWKGEDVTFQLLLDTYDAHQRCQQEQSAIIQTQLIPEQLGLPASLVADVRVAMVPGESFLDFLRHALERESKTLIGLARMKKERETKPKQDFTQVPTADLLKARRAPEAIERIRRAIATLIEYNRHCDDPLQRWYITQTLLRDFIGAHPRFIKPVLEANEKLIQRHHEHFGITSAHNRTPIPKSEPIKATKLRIAEKVAELSVLDEVALPSLDVSSGCEEEAAMWDESEG